MQHPTFQPLSPAEEARLLSQDTNDWERTKIYIKPLIAQALARFVLSKGIRAELTQQLISDVPIAAERFLSHTEKKPYTFATYFTWYISERVNAHPDIKAKSKD